MKVNKNLVGIYAVYAGLGVVTGVLFGKSQYHKGKLDAYTEVTEELTKVSEEIEEMVSEVEGEEA